MKRLIVTLAALLCVGALAATITPIAAQTKKEVKVKPLNTKKWCKYDVGEIRFHDKATHTEGSQIYNRLIPNPAEYISECAREVLATLYFSPKDSITPVKSIYYTLEDKEGVSAKGGGRGRIHIFYSTPRVSNITFSSSLPRYELSIWRVL